MNEEILYEAGPIKITPARVVSGGSTYAVANITSVKAVTDHTFQIYGVIAAIGGLAVAFIGAVGAIVLGVAAIIAGILLVIVGQYTDVVITTGASERPAFRSRDEKAALAVASAVNLAIMKRSALPGR